MIEYLYTDAFNILSVILIIAVFTFITYLIARSSRKELKKQNLELEKTFKESSRNLALMQIITTAANDPNNNFMVAMQIAVDEICNHVGWPVGHVYFYDHDEHHLSPSGIWFLEDPMQYNKFHQITDKTIFEIGEGLPGKAFVSKKPEWISDIQKVPEFIRGGKDQDTTLHAGFTFPVIAGNEVTAVLEFFTTEILPPNRDLLDLMVNIGTQLGRVTERKTASDQLKKAYDELEILVEERTKELRSSQGRLQSLFNTVMDPIITIDQKGLIQEFNPAAESTFGYEANEVVGKNLKMLMPEPYRSEHDGYLANYFKTGDAKVIGAGREVEAQHKDGSTFPIELGVSEAVIDGETIYVGIIRDITERKKSEEEIKLAHQQADKARIQAEEATQLKSEFLANMSHEIRTPMNGIIGMSNLLLDTKLSSKQQNYLDTVIYSADSLLELVNDILDFSKIEAGKLELETIPFDFRTLVEEVSDIMAVKAQETGVEMLLRYPPGSPRYVMGDPGRVRQIFLNLASNALKFTEEGYILIGVESEETESGVEFYSYIEDTGIGIPEDKLDHIFSKFNQADGSTTRKFGGTGLGLAICQELSLLMDGDIGVESTVGKGSKFWFKAKLDLDVDSNNRRDIDLDIELSGLKALIVDDNEHARNILSEYLEFVGMEVTTVTSGGEAMKELSKTETVYDVALLDFSMPEMDGLELAKVIRENPSLEHMSLIIVTSCPERGDCKVARRAGFSGYLTKPTNRNDLLKVISAVISAQKDNKAIELITKHTIREALQYKKENKAQKIYFEHAQVLLAEDNPVNQVVATTMLQKYGCHVTPAGNGKEVLNLINQHEFDLIFMDCQMPEMDGFEATHAIRKLEEKNNLPRIPIIAFTANAMKGDDEKCFAAGMDDYLSKPVKDESLTEMLLKWLEKEDDQAQESSG